MYQDSIFSQTIFKQKYSHNGRYTYPELCAILVEEVCQADMSKQDKADLTQIKQAIRLGGIG